MYGISTLSHNNPFVYACVSVCVCVCVVTDGVGTESRDQNASVRKCEVKSSRSAVESSAT